MDIRPVTLEGKRVRLEPLSLDHVDGLWAAGSDPELWRLTSARIDSREAMRAYVEAALADRNALPFCTLDRESGRVAGTTRFGNIAPEHKRVEIGWTFLAPEWQ